MRSHEIIDEIGTLPSSVYTGRSALAQAAPPAQLNQLKPVPGSDQLLYWVGSVRSYIEITVWNRDRIESGHAVGTLGLVAPEIELPVPRPSQVDYIAVAPQYQGQGVAQSMYQVVLRDLRRTLIAGAVQTPSGQRAWVTMWRTPGVEVRGWLQIADTLVADDNGAIDTLMGEIGADYMGARRTPGWAKPDRYFSFEVQSMASGQRMEAAVQTQMNKLYGGVRSADLVEAVGMYAVWRGT